MKSKYKFFEWGTNIFEEVNEEVEKGKEDGNKDGKEDGKEDGRWDGWAQKKGLLPSEERSASEMETMLDQDQVDEDEK